MDNSRVGSSNFLSSRADRPMQRPPGIASWVDDRPAPTMTAGLAFQQVAVMAGNFVLPVAAAGAFTQDPAEITRFLCLSILAIAVWQALQLLTRGPLGCGYAMPATHQAAMLGAYLITAHAGGGFGAASAMVFLSGLAALVLTFAMHRLRVLLPNEVAGVVVILIGLSLAALAGQQLGLAADGAHPGPEVVAIALGGVAVMAAATLSRTRAAPFAVLIGGLAATAASMSAGLVRDDAGAVLAASPWIALPEPWLPDFGEVRTAPMLAFLLSLIAVQAGTAGSIVMMQRAADAGWTRPDAQPIRRGLLANGVAIAATGAIGGMAPGPSTVVLGMSITAGTLARVIVWATLPMYLLLAACPKAVALFVLMPAPVKAAILFFVSGFIMAQGCQLATARLLDTRRAMVVAFGLVAGLTAAISPLALLATMPALASPLAFGAVVSFLANVATLPLVTKRAERAIPLDAGASRAASDWAGGLARGWGLKPQTGRALERAAVALAELLAWLNVAQLAYSARRSEDRVELTLAWQGPPLPERAPAGAEDLLGDDTQVARTMLWAATREAIGFGQRATATGQEARLVFED